MRVERPIVPAGTWVELELVLLEASARAEGVPADTADHPFAARVRGFLVAPAREGDLATVRTQADRMVTGTLRTALPRNPADFGDPEPALLEVATALQARLRQGRTP
jgi:AKP thiolase subunit OrtA